MLKKQTIRLINCSWDSATAVSNDLNYGGMDVEDVSVVNLDDDTAGITVSPQWLLLGSVEPGQPVDHSAGVSTGSCRRSVALATASSPGRSCVCLTPTKKSLSATLRSPAGPTWSGLMGGWKRP